MRGARCARGAMCTSRGDVHRCNAVILRNAGETCTDNFDLSTDARFEVCDPSQELRCESEAGTCAVTTRVGQGEACAGAGTRCKRGLFCDDTGHCLPPQTDGTACRAAPQCESRLCRGGICMPAEVCHS